MPNIIIILIIELVMFIENALNLKEYIAMNNMLNTMQTMIVLLIVIASLLGIVIIYNLGVLSFSEKQYQFATLKVLGFKKTRSRRFNKRIINTKKSIYISTWKTNNNKDFT